MLLRYPYLMQCMHGLLMLLPQTEAFKTLYVRLKSTPVVPLSLASALPLSDSNNIKRHRDDRKGNLETPHGLDYAPLVDHFDRCQQQRNEREDSNAHAGR